MMAALMTITQLYAVQEIDTALDQLRYRRSHLPEAEAVAATDAELKRLAAEATAKSAERDTLATEEHRLERDDDMLTKKLGDLQSKLSKTIVPKEAETFQMEIKAVKQQRSNLEDRELELLGEIEPIEARLAEIAEATTALNERRAEQQTALEVASSAIDAEIADASARRTSAASVLDPGAIARYEKTRAHLGGVAIARLDHGTCLGCNMKIAAKELEALKAAPPDAEVSCESCGRLLLR